MELAAGLAAERNRICDRSLIGTSRRFAATQQFGRLRSEADIALVFAAEAAGEPPGGQPGAPGLTADAAVRLINDVTSR
jgi:hypothetical protein